MNGGAYEQALNAWNDVLTGNPSDVDAIVGQQQAREKLIDSKLIEVRLSRMGGNTQNSIDLLLNLSSLESEWKFYPKGKVAFTQEEESGFALQYIGTRTNEELKKGHAVPAANLLKKYRPIFEGNLLHSFVSIQKKVQTAGVQQCEKFAREQSSDTPYFGYFVKQYCRIWNQSARDIASSDESRQKGLFKELRVEIKINGLEPAAYPAIIEEIQSAFKNSVWYGPRPKVS